MVSFFISGSKMQMNHSLILNIYSTLFFVFSNKIKSNVKINRYDVFDHNDPNKTGSNWTLLPEEEYEAPWFPQGTPCELAIQRVSLQVI